MMGNYFLSEYYKLEMLISSSTDTPNEEIWDDYRQFLVDIREYYDDSQTDPDWIDKLDVWQKLHDAVENKSMNNISLLHTKVRDILPVDQATDAYPATHVFRQWSDLGINMFENDTESNDFQYAIKQLLAPASKMRLAKEGTAVTEDSTSTEAISYSALSITLRSEATDHLSGAVDIVSEI